MTEKCFSSQNDIQ